MTSYPPEPQPAESRLPEPHSLELRIHGVNNTSPPNLLEVSAEDVERSRGDSLGSFWTPTAAAIERADKVAERTGGEYVPPDHVPPDTRREAYSWGPMARNSPSLPGMGANAVVSAASRAGWMLLAPLGLANAAYWSRRLLQRQHHDSVRLYGRGARFIRLFGFGLTLLLVTSVETVSLNLIATQCFTGQGHLVCTVLPGWLGTLESFTWTQRLAVLSLSPLAALLGLVWLSAGARVRYELPTSNPVASNHAPGDPGPILADPGLWSRWGLTRSMARLHFAGGLALVVLTLTLSQLPIDTSMCHDVHSCFQRALNGSGDHLQYSLLSVAAFLVLIASGVLTSLANPEREPNDQKTLRRPAPIVLLAASALFLWTLVALWLQPAARTVHPNLPDLDATPGFLVTALFLIALIGLTWRRHANLSRAATVLALLVCGALIWKIWTNDATSAPLWIAGALFAVLCVVCCSPYRRDLTIAGGEKVNLCVEAWWGGAPGVLLILSLGIGLMLTDLMVVAAGDWLNGAAAAECLNGTFVNKTAIECNAGSGTPASLTIPSSYTIFAITTLLALTLAALILLLLLGIVTLRGMRGSAVPESPAGERMVERVPEDLTDERDAARRTRQPAGKLSELITRPDLVAALERARDFAAVAQRGVWFTGSCALGFAGAITVTIYLSVNGSAFDGAAPWFPQLTSFGLWATALIWVAVIARVVTAQGAPHRPIALVWDLICFLPRSAHPFGPPCYAERAVPEIAARMDAWLNSHDLPPDEPDDRRQVILAAHSLGAVLAIAALFTGDAQTQQRRRQRVGLLTYGTQVRSYFGRIFPELFGPAVLGTPGCGPTSIGRNPWAGADADALRIVPDEHDTLVRRLGGSSEAISALPPAWLSLWRRTDPLGMPVHSYSANPIDRGAEEIDATGYLADVATHGNYPRQSAYRRALEDLNRDLERGHDRPGGQPGP